MANTKNVKRRLAVLAAGAMATGALLVGGPATVANAAPCYGLPDCPILIPEGFGGAWKDGIKAGGYANENAGGGYATGEAGGAASRGQAGGAWNHTE